MNINELNSKIEEIDFKTKQFIKRLNDENMIKLENKYNKCLTLIREEIENYTNREDKENESLYVNTINLLMKELDTLALSIQLFSNKVDESTIYTFIEKLPVNEKVKNKFINVSLNLLSKNMISELSYILSILDSEEVNEKLLNFNQLTREEKDNYLKKASSQYSKGIINKEETQILDNISYLTYLLISSEKEYYDEKLLEIFLDSIIDYPIIIDNKRVIFNFYDLINQFEVIDIQMSSVDTIKSISYQVPQTGENIYIENIGNAVLSKHFFPNNHSSIRYYLNDIEISETDYNTFLEVSKKYNNKKYKTPVFDDERFLADIHQGPILEEKEEASSEDIEHPLEYLKKKNSRKK